MHENARTLGGALPRRSSAGLTIAAVLGYLVYAGGNKLNLKTFFNITGILLVLFAAGLAGKAIHEFRELIEWESGVHDFLKALFGWAPAPERLRVIAYFSYLIPVLWLYIRKGTPGGNNERTIATETTHSTSNA